MKKKFKKVVAVLLVLALLPVGSIYANQSDEAAKGFANQVKGSDYAAGQAIIMYKTATKNLNSFQGSITDDKMEIVETYEFDAVEKKTVSQNTIISKNGSASLNFTSSNKGSASLDSMSSAKDTFAVSLVQSDQYSTEELIEKLSLERSVIYAEPNYKIHALDTDPYKKYQWAVKNTGQNAGTEGKDVQIDSVTTPASGEEKIIALVDTGIDYEHEDLKDVVWNNPYSSKKLAGKHGYDFINHDTDPMDDNGHGTHCSGIMRANADNSIGVQGIVKSSNIKIMALKTLDEDGSGYGMEAVGAYNYIYKAQQLGANVVAVNNSWGGSDQEESDILKELMELVGKQGALSVCAAGNEGLDNDIYETFPCNIDSDYVISVAASNENDEIAGFSNYGKKTVDITAPGTDILSTVSYDKFNPALYGKGSPLMSLYDPFDTLDGVEPVIRDNGILGYSDVENSNIEITDETYFGAEKGKSLKWSIKNAKEGEGYYLDIPYHAPKSKTDIYSGVTVKAEGPVGDVEDGLFGLEKKRSMLYVCDNPIKDGEILEDIMGAYVINGTTIDGGYWSTMYDTLGNRKACDRVITVMLHIDVDGDYDIYLDDLAVSAADVKSEAFGKYAFYNGTSMATPFVCASAAILSEVYPDDSVLTRKGRLLGSTRKEKVLNDKVSSSGILDLSKAGLPYMTVSDMTVNQDNMQLEIKGSFMSGASVYINDEMTASEYDEETGILSVDVSAYKNKTISLKISKDQYDYTTDFYVAVGKKYVTVKSSFDTYFDGGGLVSDGNCLYYVNAEGVVTAAKYEEVEDSKGKKNKQLNFTDMFTAGYDIEMFGKEYKTIRDYYIYGSSFIAPANQKLYQILTLDLGYSAEKVLAVYIPEKGWEIVAALPEYYDDYEGMTLAMYNGVPYLLGGFNADTGELTDVIYKYADKKWSEAGKLPEKRAYAKAIQTGDELVVTLGSDGSEKTPKNLILKGNIWNVSKADFGEVKEKEEITFENAEQEVGILYVTSAETGLIKDGIIYTGVCIEGMGDTVTYSVSKDQYAASDYSLINTQVKGDTYFATTWENKLYVVSGEESEYDPYDDDYSKSKKASENEGEKKDDAEEEPLAYVYAINVPNGMMRVNEKSEEVDGYIEGAGGHLPGDTIVLTAKINDFAKDYAKITGMAVDGKAVKANSKGIYTYTVKNLAPGKTIDASITVSYGDEPEIVGKGSIFVSGAFIYKVTKFSNKNKAVSIISYNKKKKGKTAKISKTFKKQGYLFKVTEIAAGAFSGSKKLNRIVVGQNIIKIGKKAFAKCPKLTNVLIKSSKIKTFGKNLFKKTNKKLKVKVPKKKLKVYKKKLKKAGFKGKVSALKAKSKKKKQKK